MEDGLDLDPAHADPDRCRHIRMEERNQAMSTRRFEIRKQGFEGIQIFSNEIYEVAGKMIKAGVSLNTVLKDLDFNFRAVKDLVIKDAIENHKARIVETDPEEEGAR